MSMYLNKYTGCYRFIVSGFRLKKPKNNKLNLKWMWIYLFFKTSLLDISLLKKAVYIIYHRQQYCSIFSYF